MDSVTLERVGRVLEAGVEPVLESLTVGLAEYDSELHHLDQQQPDEAVEDGEGASCLPGKQGSYPGSHILPGRSRMALGASGSVSVNSCCGRVQYGDV